jgi:hypothetical protein
VNGAGQARLSAYGVAALFVLAFARFFVLPPEGRGNVLVAFLGVAPHLLLFPVVGLLLALDLGVYSFVAPFDPTHFAGLLPTLILLPLWLVLLENKMAHGTGALA